MKYKTVLFDWGGTLGDHKLRTQNDWTERMIRDLHRSGYRLGIISNNNRYADTRWLRHKLSDLGWIEYFQIIVGSSEMHDDTSDLHCVGISKPDPRIFKRVLEFLSIPASEAVYVGDTHDADVLGPRSVGMSALLVKWPEDYSDRLWELLQDVPKDRKNILTQFSITPDGEKLQIETRLRHLNDPLEVGDEIICGNCTYVVEGWDLQHTKDEILHAHRELIHISALTVE